MIDVEEAKRIIMRHVRCMPCAPVRSGSAGGYHLAHDVKSLVPHPLFDMSAVDGYVLNGPGPVWRITGSIAAGAVLGRSLGRGECARIFTGAGIPDGGDRVVMQERVTLSGQEVRADVEPPIGANIRRTGEQFEAGSRIAGRGDRLNPAAIGLLATSGIVELDVALKPSVAIVRTGDEFRDTGGPPEGRIFSSNEHMLSAALAQEGCDPAPDGVLHAADDDEDLMRVLEHAAIADVIITTGGVSVGDHDRVAAVLERSGACIHFHGVAQKPGKPMLFATLNGKAVFGLPGNPRAVMILFWEYVLPYLRAMQGDDAPWPRADRLPIDGPLRIKGDRLEFRPVRVQDGRVHPLADEGSHMLRSLVDAHALAYLPPTVRELQRGDTVEIHYLP